MGLVPKSAVGVGQQKRAIQYREQRALLIVRLESCARSDAVLDCHHVEAPRIAAQPLSTHPWKREARKTHVDSRATIPVPFLEPP
jgi:uncharacterized CHY-type Zn-finger protein